MKPSSFFAMLRRNFFGGLFVLFPLFVIAMILQWLFSYVWDLLELLPESLKPNPILDPFSVTGLNLALFIGVCAILFIVVSLMGLISKLYLGRKLFEALGDLIERIPVLGAIYSSLDQLIQTMTAGGGKQFNRVVYVEYPRKGVWAVGFVTGAVKSPQFPTGYLNIFVPTVPNPTAGFHLLVDEKEVIETQLRVEDAFKTILSLGITQPLSGSPAGSNISDKIIPSSGKALT